MMPGARVQADHDAECLSAPDSDKLLMLAALMPHGVDRMSHVMPGLVETSCNLASVQQDGATFTVCPTIDLAIVPLHDWAWRDG